MTAPAWRSAGTFVSGTGAVTPGLPAGWQENDIFLLAVTSVEGDAITTPSGWTQVTGSPVFPSASSTGSRLAVFWRRATASESAPNIADSGDHTAAIIHAFSGCRLTGTPFDTTVASWNDSAGTTQFHQNMTTTVNDTMLVWFSSHGVSQTTPMYSGFDSFGSAANVTERSDDSTNQGLGGGLGVVTGTRAAPGGPIDMQITLATASSRSHIGVALQPAALTATPTAAATAAVTVQQPKGGVGSRSGYADVFAYGYDVIPPSAPMATGSAATTGTANSSVAAVRPLAGHVVAAVTTNQPAVQSQGNLKAFPDQVAVPTQANSPTPQVKTNAQGIG